MSNFHRSHPEDAGTVSGAPNLPDRKGSAATHSEGRREYTAPDTVMLIHGLWMNGRSWEHWVERYEARGLTVIADSWPGMPDDVEVARADTTAYEDLGVEEIVDFYERRIRQLDRPPIIMGHSFGGVFTQILLDRGLGAAGVAIDSAAVKGMVVLPPSTIRSGFPVLKSPANRHKAVALSHSEFHYAFTNTMSEEQSAEVYERYAVPGPGGVLFQGALANFNPNAATRVDFRNDDRAPLLFIAGGADHVSPASLNRSNAKHYKRSEAVTEYKEFLGRSHYTLGQDGWEEVADYALEWALACSPAPGPATA
jgi:pimeloyl-ACP methyl ester carboxylesterase